MIWVLVDVLLALLALGWLALRVLAVWRTTTALGRQVARSGDSLAAATDALSAAYPETGSTRR